MEVDGAEGEVGVILEADVRGVGIGGLGTRGRSVVGEVKGGCSCDDEVGVDNKDGECCCSLMSCHEAMVEMTRIPNIVSVQVVEMREIFWDYKEGRGRSERGGIGRRASDSTSDGEFISAKGGEAPAGQGKMTENHNEKPKNPRERDYEFIPGRRR